MASGGSFATSWHKVRGYKSSSRVWRVEERASVLILQALSPDLQTEAISTRALSSVALLFLTMSRFQPGGSAEKATILAYLTQPTTEGPAGVQANQQALRKWERLFRRWKDCKELGLQMPHPTLLVRSLDTLVKVIGNKSPPADGVCRTLGINTNLMLCLLKPLFCTSATCSRPSWRHCR